MQAENLADLLLENTMPGAMLAKASLDTGGVTSGSCGFSGTSWTLSV